MLASSPNPSNVDRNLCGKLKFSMLIKIKGAVGLTQHGRDGDDDLSILAGSRTTLEIYVLADVCSPR